MAVSLQPDPVARRGRNGRLARVRDSRLVRQNLVLFAGGVTAGLGGFVYHAIAGRVLGPAAYGEVASLVALYAVGTAVNLILILVLARYAAALLAEHNEGGIRYLIGRSTRVIVVPALVFVMLLAVLSGPAAAFLKLGSPFPVIWLGAAIAAIWFTAIPRGVLQGTQHFQALSLNLGSEIVLRTIVLGLLLWAGLAVNGAMIAILAGATFGYALGMFSLRELRRVEARRARMRTMLGFSLMAAAGTLGILLLYNLDVILAKHYLNGHDAGIYGGLNKIGTIVYFGTLSVSQVLFPRVVEAVATNTHPMRLLWLSAGILSFLGGCALLVFGLFSRLVVVLLFGDRFLDAQPYIFAVGLIGLGLSLDNLLVQFFMALRDRVFMPLLGLACLLQATLIVLHHGGVGDVVVDVLIAIFALFAALSVRCLLLAPSLRPEMVTEA